MAHVVYDNLKVGLLDGTLDFGNDDIYCLLVQETNPTIVTSSSLVSDAMSNEYSGTSTTVLTETSGVNYTAGGKKLTNVQTYNNGIVIALSADNLEWSSSTITAGGALIYKHNGGQYTLGNPLIYIDFAASRVSQNGSFPITWNSEGIIEITS